MTGHVSGVLLTSQETQWHIPEEGFVSMPHGGCWPADAFEHTAGTSDGPASEPMPLASMSMDPAAYLGAGNSGQNPASEPLQLSGACAKPTARFGADPPDQLTAEPLNQSTPDAADPASESVPFAGACAAPAACACPSSAQQLGAKALSQHAAEEDSTSEPVLLADTGVSPTACSGAGAADDPAAEPACGEDTLGAAALHSASAVRVMQRTRRGPPQRYESTGLLPRGRGDPVPGAHIRFASDSDSGNAASAPPPAVDAPDPLSHAEQAEVSSNLAGAVESLGLAGTAAAMAAAAARGDAAEAAASRASESGGLGAGAGAEGQVRVLENPDAAAAMLAVAAGGDAAEAAVCRASTSGGPGTAAGCASGSALALLAAAESTALAAPGAPGGGPPAAAGARGPVRGTVRWPSASQRALLEVRRGRLRALVSHFSHVSGTALTVVMHWLQQLGRAETHTQEHWGARMGWRADIWHGCL